MKAVRQMMAYDILRDEYRYRLDLIGIRYDGDIEQIHVDFRRGQKTPAMRLLRKMARKSKLKPLVDVLQPVEGFRTSYLPLHQRSRA